MDKRSILQSIIDNEGKCQVLYRDEDGKDSMCATCPMSKLAKRSDGTYLGCWDSLIYKDYLNHLNPEDLPHGGVDKIYLDKAVELLSDILMDDILRGIPIAENT